MKRFGVVLILLYCVIGEGGMVVSVGPRFKMSNQEPIAAKDYFIDLGRREGVKEGDLLTVFRDVVPLHGQTGTPQAPVKVMIGEVVVVAVGERASFVRQSPLKTAAVLPFSEPAVVMLGDEVQTKTRLPFQP